MTACVSSLILQDTQTIAWDVSTDWREGRTWKMLCKVLIGTGLAVFPALFSGLWMYRSPPVSPGLQQMSGPLRGHECNTGGSVKPDHARRRPTWATGEGFHSPGRQASSWGCVVLRGADVPRRRRAVGRHEFASLPKREFASVATRARAIRAELIENSPRAESTISWSGSSFSWSSELFDAL